MTMKNEIIVGMVQINERKEGMGRSGHQRNQNNQLIEEVSIYPYSVGLLESYAKQNFSEPDRLHFLLTIYKRERVADAVNALKNADIVGFSTYIWNINLSLAIAEGLRAANPNVVIVFGGPQMPDKAEAFLKEHRFIDLICHGEGEQVFVSILENFTDRNWQKVPSISYFEDSDFHATPRLNRIKDLGEIPSPYLNGTFEPLREANPTTSWIMLWETNRGCPFSCTYCDWGSAVGAKVYKFDEKRLYRELEWYAKTGDDIIFCCDANFGMLPRDYDLAEFAVLLKKTYKHPRILTVQNTKNATERAYKVQTLLASAYLNPVVTLSMQSLNDSTLDAIKRKNISLDSFKELQRRFTKDKVMTYTDVILGMPGETYDSYLDGISEIIEGGQHHRILFYNLSILPNAEMGDPTYQQKYGLKVVPQLIQNLHTHLYEIEEIEEFIETVVASNSMPENDWVKCKMYWWITELFYYNYAIKLPIAILNQEYGLPYRTILEAFLSVNKEDYPVLARFKDFFEDKAIKIQNGGIEFCPSQEWLGIFWSAEQYAWIEMVLSGQMTEFYAEVTALLKEILYENNIDFDEQLVEEICQLNYELMCKPQDYGDVKLIVSWNFWEVYVSITTGEPVMLQEGNYEHHIEKQGLHFTTNNEWLEHFIVSQNFKAKNIYPQQIYALETVENI